MEGGRTDALRVFKIGDREGMIPLDGPRVREIRCVGPRTLPKPVERDARPDWPARRLMRGPAPFVHCTSRREDDGTDQLPGCEKIISRTIGVGDERAAYESAAMMVGRGGSDGDQSVRHRVFRELGCRAQPELFHDACFMELNRFYGDAENRRDLFQ